MKTLWIVAQNPANETNIYMPLYGTKSGSTLEKWLKGVKYDHLIASNACMMVTSKPRVSEDDLGRLSLVYDMHKPDKVIALGKLASKALKKLGVSHFEAIHPSPKNRKLNDKNYVDNMVKNMKQYLKGGT